MTSRGMGHRHVFAFGDPAIEGIRIQIIIESGIFTTIKLRLLASADCDLTAALIDSGLAGLRRDFTVIVEDIDSVAPRRGKTNITLRGADDQIGSLILIEDADRETTR